MLYLSNRMDDETDEAEFENSRMLDDRELFEHCLRLGRLSEVEAKRFTDSDIIDAGFRRDGKNWRIES